MIRSVDADGGIIEYQYDAAGNLIARISPSQSLVYSHDARNRMASVTRTVDGEAPATTTYEYDQVGNRTAMTTGGVRNEYSLRPPSSPDESVEEAPPPAPCCWR
jgi:YD repeat-containing protein